MSEPAPGLRPATRIGVGDLFDLPELRSGAVAASLAAARDRSRQLAHARLEAGFARLADATTEPRTGRRFDITDPGSLAAACWDWLDQLQHRESGPSRVELVSTADQHEVWVDRLSKFDRAVVGRLAGALLAGAAATVVAVDDDVAAVGVLADAIERWVGMATRIDLAVVPVGGEAIIRTAGQGAAVAVLEGTIEPRSAVAPGPVTAGSGICFGAAAELRLAGVTSTALVLVALLPEVTVASLGHLAAPLGVRHPMLRADLPWSVDDPIHSYAGSILTDPDLADQEYRRLLGEETVGKGLASHLAHLPSRYTSVLSTALDGLDAGPGRWTVRCPVGGGFVLGGEGPDLVTLGGGGIMADLAPAEALGLAAIGDGGQHRLDGVLPAALWQRLLELGWVEVVAVDTEPETAGST